MLAARDLYVAVGKIVADLLEYNAHINKIYFA